MLSEWMVAKLNFVEEPHNALQILYQWMIRGWGQEVTALCFKVKDYILSNHVTIF